MAWKRPKYQPELWTGARVARELGIARTNLYRIADLPEPAARLEPRGTVWYAAEIREFAKKRARRAGK